MDPDGSDQTNLTDDPGHDSDADWSPDGTKIVFSTSREGDDFDGEVYVMDADGSDQVNLTDEPGYDAGRHGRPTGARSRSSRRVTATTRST